MTRTCDVGSLPLVCDSEKFEEGARRYNLYSTGEEAEFFEKKVLEGLVDKIRVGIDVPNYPQFRDMNEMFLSMIDGIERIKGGYLETKIPSVKAGKNIIPEVVVIKKHSKAIREMKNSAFEIRICITGPYTLSSFFPYRRKDTFIRLGKAISQIMENSFFNDKHGRVSLFSLDEPVFGLQDDVLLDFGSEGRENLQKAWESIFHKAKSKNIQTLIHLHSTLDELFWDTDSLEVIESHVDDPIQKRKKTKEKLESTDKFLKVSLAVTNFDNLIRRRILSNSKEKLTEIAVNTQIAGAWKSINQGGIDPKIFLEEVNVMKERLANMINHFGLDRIPYAGPECGLKGFPTYKSAMECLRLVSKAL